jgi:LPXTG-site transpeptidase (sortase) family protein
VRRPGHTAFGLRWLEWTLLTSGAVLLAIVSVAAVRAALVQTRAEAHFEKRVGSALAGGGPLDAAPRAAPLRAPGELLGRLDAPMGLAGHRDRHFRGLRHLSVGDPLRFASDAGIAHYEVVDLRVVEPEAVEVLAPSDHAVLTLVTCYPFYYVGDAPQRFVVRAEQRDFVAWRRDRPVDEQVALASLPGSHPTP